MDYHLQLWQQWFKIIDPTVSSNILVETPAGSEGLFYAVPALCIYLINHIPGLTSGELSEATLQWVVYFFVSCFTLAFLLVLQFNPYRESDRMKAGFFEVIYLVSCIPIIFPHQQKYSFVLMMPAMMFAIMKWVTGKAKLFEKAMIVTAFLLMVVTTDGIIGRDLNVITLHLKLVTLGGLMLLVILLTSIKRNTSQYP